MRNKIKPILKLALLLILMLFIELSTLGCFGKPTPQLTSIDPSRGTNIDIVTVTLTGVNFNQKVTVKLIMAGQADIVARDVKFLSKTQIVASFDLNGKAVGQWDLVVSNTRKRIAKLINAFTIEYPAPAVIAVSPNQGANNSPLIISDLVGSDFRFGIKVLLRKSGQPDIAASKAALYSKSELTCVLDLTNVTPGVYDVAVMNEDGKTGILANGFTVMLFTPEPASQLEEAVWETTASEEEVAVTTEDTVDVEESKEEVLEEEPMEAESDSTESGEVVVETAESEEEALDEEPIGAESDSTESGEVVLETAESEEEALEEELMEAESDSTESGEVVVETAESEEEALDEEPIESEEVVEETADSAESEEEVLGEESTEAETDSTESEEAVVDETVEIDETKLDLTQPYVLQALLNVLENKGILTQEEVLAELEKINATMGEYLEEDEMADESGVIDEEPAESEADNPEENAE